MNVDVVAISTPIQPPRLSMATYAYVHDLANEDEILAVARKHRIDGVMTMAADYPMVTDPNRVYSIEPPGPSPEVVAKSTNKQLMRLALRENRVACPGFIHVVSLEQAKQAVAKLAADTIFKPAMSQGGRGITRLPVWATETEMNRHISVP